MIAAPEGQAAISAAGLSGRLVAIAACWCLSFFASLSEASLVRLELSRVRQLAEEGGWRRRRLLAMVEDKQEVLSTLILLVNITLIIAAAYTTEITIHLSGGDPRWIAGASAAMICFILIFCEVTPKTYGVRRAEAVGLAVTPALFVIHTLVRPFGRVLHAIGLVLIRRAVVPIFGGVVQAELPQYTDQEVIEMMVEGEANGDIEQEEREMIAGVIEFTDKVAREVMTPRTDIAWLPETATLAEAADLSAQRGYSRLPVCAGDLDHVIGIVYVKDLLSALAAGRPGLTAGQIARKPAPMVPESKGAAELLNLMQRRRLHMAIVIDEYGGTAGLVTIEDLLEEIFGEIRDEHDFESEPIDRIDENAAMVDARVSVDDIEDHFGVALPEGEYDSIGGLILDLLGHLPTAGETTSWRNLDFVVEAVSSNRIQRVRIVRRPTDPEADLLPGGGAEQS